MADFLKSFFGAAPTTTSGGLADDFADYATAASSSVASAASAAASNFFGSSSSSSPPPPQLAMSPVPDTAWYRVWARTSLADFKIDAVMLSITLLIILQLVWGRSTNRRKARSWVAAHAPILEREFASVGFSGVPHGKIDDAQGPTDPAKLLRERTATEFAAYATGRQNVAFLDVKISLYRRFNPFVWMLETLASLMFAIVKAPKENVEVAIYTFDGHEKDLVPVPTRAVEGEEMQARAKVAPSSYDGFVWALVHKDYMKEFRSDRFDVSLTDVKDNAKLPSWIAVMSENAEVTDALLTPDLIKAIETAGSDLFEYLLVSDMPADKPASVDEMEPRKRLSLSMKLPSGSSVSTYDRTLALFSHFVRLPDELVQKAHFRAEVQRKLKKTREEETARVRKATDDERAEERKLEADKRKKQEREDLLRTMSPADQRKYLDKEREKQNRRGQRRVRA